MRKNIPVKKAEDTEEVVARYKKLIYGIALTHLNRKSEAEDVFQEVFLTYYGSGAEFESEEHKKAWLIRTALNLCKRSNSDPWHIRTVSMEGVCAEDRPVFDTDEETQVFEALGALKPKYKIPIYLFYFENMPVEKIAELLRIKKDTVRKRLSRGRQFMKERLECDYFE